jgi:hypothetical protein
MTDLLEKRVIIQAEETVYDYGLSQRLFQRFGQIGNFISKRQHSEKQFYVNGNYGNLAVSRFPQLAVDGMVFFEFDAFLINVWMFVEYAGASGDTQFDVLRATAPGGAFTSIFTTKPSINYQAGNFTWVSLGSAVAHTTAPVLALTNVNQGDALRMDMITGQAGNNAAGAGLLIHYRPR